MINRIKLNSTEASTRREFIINHEGTCITCLTLDYALRYAEWLNMNGIECEIIEIE